MKEENIHKLLNEAKSIAEINFCCSHSNFTVGAALLTIDGKIYKGFNIENDGIQSICAERVAFAKALSEGNHEFTCIAVVGKNLKDKEYLKTLPCGYCRQFMREYTHPDFIIYTCDTVEDKIYTYKLKELLPESFNLNK